MASRACQRHLLARKPGSIVAAFKDVRDDLKNEKAEA